MRLSKYIVKKETSNSYILFSTISKTIIKVDKEYYAKLKSDNINNLLSKSDLEFLKSNYFLVKDDIDERKIVKYIMNKERLDQKIFSSYMTFSTMCNFACVYCYEEGQTNRDNIMSKETLNDVINWYDFIIKKNNYKEIRVCLFGGEPLIHKDLIKLFVTELDKIVKCNDAKLSITMVTNGYLLDQKTITFLKEHNLEEIQITIDGVGKIHDERRPLKSGKGTFDKILENIINAPKFNGRFLFRVSFDKNNLKNVKELLKYLSKLNIVNEYDVYLAPIHNTTSQECQHCSFCNLNIYNEDDEIIKNYKELYGYMKNLNMEIPKYYTNGPCMSISNDSVLIDNEGNLFKCVEMIGIEDLKIGNVKDLEYNNNYFNFVGIPLYEECINRDCKYVALCGGGCIMKSYLKDRTLNNIDCQLKYFEELIPFFLGVNYDE